MDDNIFISQLKYALDLWKRFKVECFKPCATPYPLIVTLTKECDSSKIDATLNGQLLLFYFISITVSRFMQDPKKVT
jgi:hypothetical protein